MNQNFRSCRISIAKKRRGNHNNNNNRKSGKSKKIPKESQNLFQLIMKNKGIRKKIFTFSVITILQKNKLYSQTNNLTEAVFYPYLTRQIKSNYF